MKILVEKRYPTLNRVKAIKRAVDILASLDDDASGGVDFEEFVLYCEEDVVLATLPQIIIHQMRKRLLGVDYWKSKTKEIRSKPVNKVLFSSRFPEYAAELTGKLPEALRLANTEAMRAQMQELREADEGQLAGPKPIIVKEHKALGGGIEFPRTLKKIGTIKLIHLAKGASSKVLDVSKGVLRAAPGLENLRTRNKGSEEDKEAEAEAVETEEGNEYSMTSEERQKYGTVFRKLDEDGSGTLDGAEAAPLLMRSGLPTSVLKNVWQLSDVDKEGSLNEHEWAVAMHLIICIGTRGLPVPAALPQCLLEEAWDGHEPPPPPGVSQEQLAATGPVAASGIEPHASVEHGVLSLSDDGADVEEQTPEDRFHELLWETTLALEPVGDAGYSFKKDFPNLWCQSKETKVTEKIEKQRRGSVAKAVTTRLYKTLSSLMRDCGTQRWKLNEAFHTWLEVVSVAEAGPGDSNQGTRNEGGVAITFKEDDLLDIDNLDQDMHSMIVSRLEGEKPLDLELQDLFVADYCQAILERQKTCNKAIPLAMFSKGVGLAA
ncbi:unnamed protein product [Chrysoparadoxa australica]